MRTYNLKKGGVIECIDTEVKSTFTLDDLQNQINYHEKALKELAGNADMKKAICDNILSNNSFMTKMKPEQVHACFMYHEATAARMSFTDKWKTFKKALKADKDELAIILEQIPELNKKENE